MKIRHFVLIALLLATFGLRAQTFPAKPITFVVPAAAGGAVDVLARALAQQMGPQLGQQIIVENKPGAGGILGAMAVAQAAPDGYTLLVTHSGPILTVPHMVPNVRYDVKKDFTYITQLCTGSLVLVVNTTVAPVKDMAEFIAWAEKNKGKVSYGSYGTGGSGHLLSAYLDQSRKLDMTHVAYKGEGALLQDLAGGQVAWGVVTAGTITAHLQSGRLRAIAILGDRRLPELPQVPTMAEAGFPDPEYKPVGWAGLIGPPGLPPAVLEKLEKEARAAIQTAAMKTRFQAFGMYALGTTSSEFRRDVDQMAPITGRLVKLSGAKID